MSTRPLFMGKTHQQALAALVRGVLDREPFIALTGDQGVGKTALLNAALTMLAQHTVRVRHLNNPGGEPMTLALVMAKLLGKEPGAVAGQDIEQLFEIITTGDPDHPLVLVFDDAHWLQTDVLRYLQIVFNLEAMGIPHQQVVFVGRPEFWENLETGRCFALAERIRVRCVVDRLSGEEAREYIRQRIEVADGSGPKLLTTPALAEITRRCGGNPGQINRVLDRVLRLAAEQPARLLTAATVSAAMGPSETGASSQQFPIVAAIAGPPGPAAGELPEPVPLALQQSPDGLSHHPDSGAADLVADASASILPAVVAAHGPRAIWRGPGVLVCLAAMLLVPTGTAVWRDTPASASSSLSGEAPQGILAFGGIAAPAGAPKSSRGPASPPAAATGPAPEVEPAQPVAALGAASGLAAAPDRPIPLPAEAVPNEVAQDQAEPLPPAAHAIAAEVVPNATSSEMSRSATMAPAITSAGATASERRAAAASVQTLPPHADMTEPGRIDRAADTKPGANPDHSTAGAASSDPARAAGVPSAATAASPGAAVAPPASGPAPTAGAGAAADAAVPPPVVVEAPAALATPATVPPVATTASPAAADSSPALTAALTVAVGAPAAAAPPASADAPAAARSSAKVPSAPTTASPAVADAAPAPPAVRATAAMPPTSAAAPTEAAAAPTTGSGRSTAAIGPSVQSANPPLEPLSRAMMAELLSRGDAMLAIADISAARLLYARAAAGGSGRAATQIGKTYDPAFLTQIGITGMSADGATAATWYRKAMALGDREAADRLQRLGAVARSGSGEN